MKNPSYRSEQEEFWAGDFGDAYIGRNQSALLLASNVHFFSKALARAGKIGSLIEFGANVGMNIRALQALYPEAVFGGVEINSRAADELARAIGEDNVTRGSILDYPGDGLFDISLIKGVLIHVNPALLPDVYDTLYRATKRFMLVCEYYNPSPVAIAYRGHADRLFKRDFAGEILDRFPNLALIDYGFAYHRDPAFPQDDISWFLMEKKA